jgi:hypothetical protein
VLAAVDPSQIFQLLYGRTVPFKTGAPEDGTHYGEDQAGSSLFWYAFEETGIVDWYPGMDPDPVFAKTREIAERSKAAGLMVDPAREEAGARKNYESYLKYVEQGDVEKLKAAGLWE